MGKNPDLPFFKIEKKHFRSKEAIFRSYSIINKSGKNPLGISVKLASLLKKVVTYNKGVSTNIEERYRYTNIIYVIRTVNIRVFSVLNNFRRTKVNEISLIMVDKL